ncbi:Hypothetical predicted protein [Octopus vulgaris]|uniref:Uncharacterized protein n=1 Tax=Octopus vulgaris TaxID=6645 RepID=A0AA36BN73_OCTVU|nr:Hypothetical predicted protein [Octopus vulgaris]
MQVGRRKFEQNRIHHEQLKRDVRMGLDVNFADYNYAQDNMTSSVIGPQKLTEASHLVLYYLLMACAGIGF